MSQSTVSVSKQGLVTTASVVVALILGLVQLKQYFTAPEVSIRAQVVSYDYKTAPAHERDKELSRYSIEELAEMLKKAEPVREQKLDDNQVLFMASFGITAEEEILKKRGDFYRKLLVYKVENTGDKAALDVSLVNDMSGVAQVGDAEPTNVATKDAIAIGTIPPRSSAEIYFWTDGIFYSTFDKSFIVHKDGTADVSVLEPLGGIYAYLDRHWSFLLFMALVIPLFVVLITKVNQPIKQEVDATSQDFTKKPRSHRRRNRKPRNPALPPPSQSE